MSASENMERAKNQLPEKYKDHSLAADHDYEDFEEASGKFSKPTFLTYVWGLVRPNTYITGYCLFFNFQKPSDFPLLSFSWCVIRNAYIASICLYPHA